jgi:hypothetical protein
MSSRRVRTLHRRLTRAGQCLSEAVESGLPLETLELHEKRRDLLEGMLRRVRRRRSLAWIAVAVAVALLAAVVLQYGFHLRRTRVVLNAETGAFTFENGPNQLPLNPSTIHATEIITSVPPIRWCTSRDPRRQIACEIVQSPRLNALLVNSRAVATVRTSGSCFELTVSRGTVQAIATAFEPGEPPMPRSKSATLTPGHSIRTCSERPAVLQLNGIPAVTVADQSGGAIAETVSLPALIRGTLFLADVNKAIELRRTDVPRLRQLTDSMLVARLRDSIELSVLADAAEITIDSRRSQSAMPSWLQWLASNPGLQGAVAIAGAIVAAAFAARERLLEEMG